MKLAEEDLAQQLKDTAQRKNEVEQQLADLFEAAGFKKKETMNGRSYEKSHDGLKVSFYIDSDVNFSTYITSDSFNMSMKGFIEEAVDAAQQIIAKYNEMIGQE